MYIQIFKLRNPEIKSSISNKQNGIAHCAICVGGFISISHLTPIKSNTEKQNQKNQRKIDTKTFSSKIVDTMKPDMSGSNGIGGMSRAAKKRAKKNKKKMESKMTTKDDEEHIEISSPKKKKAKLDFDGNIPGEETKMKASDLVKIDGDNSEGNVKDDLDLPSFENAGLLELLLLKDSKDEERTEQLESLSAEQRAACVFQAILDPIPVADFYKEYWEKNPLLVRAKNKQRYEGLLSLERIKEISGHFEISRTS